MNNLRMYQITMMHFNGRQQGIQGGHATAEYSVKPLEDKLDQEQKEHMGKLYTQWARTDKTVILLQAFTCQSLRDAAKELESIGVPVAIFHEPDLDNIPTAIAFIADEMMYDPSKYSDEEVLEDEAIRIARFRSIKKRFPLANS